MDLEEFERIALPTLEDIPEGGVVVIDELGKMELASTRFRDAVGALFEGDTPVVATVHAHRHPFTDELKRRGDVLVRRVTRGNRDALPKQILATLVGLGGRGLARPDGAVERAKGTELVDLRGRRYVDGSRRCRPSCTGHRQPR